VTATRAREREQGYLVIADISGYTSFLARTELEHAHGIVAELTELVIARLGESLRFVELEGDAVFAYAPGRGPAAAGRAIATTAPTRLSTGPLTGDRSTTSRSRPRRSRAVR
jgi:hypothetical protein